MNMNPWDAIAAAVTKLAARVDTMPTVREASVASLTPLSVLFDTDTLPTVVTGSLQVVAVSDRVLTLRLGHYVWILGAKGGSTFATVAETIAGIINTKAVTPASLAGSRATTGETIAGTAGDKFVTPLGLKEVHGRVGGKVRRSATTRTFPASVWYTLNTASDWVSAIPPAGGQAAFTGVWTAPVTGLYRIEAQIEFAAAANLIMILKKNNVAASDTGVFAATTVIGTAGITAANLSTLEPLAAGDYVSIAIYPAGYGGSATWLASAAWSYFGIELVQRT